MRLLLDTAVLIFAVSAPDRLSRRATAALQDIDHVLELSSVSLAEIAIKTALGKLNVTAAVSRQALHELGVRVLPYSSEHAFQLFGLPRHHADPFDRQIIAQALWEQIPVITPDEKFGLYKGLKIIW